jgi:hypothetical protein
MTDCSAQVASGFHPQLPVVTISDAPESSSDGGVLLHAWMTAGADAFQGVAVLDLSTFWTIRSSSSMTLVGEAEVRRVLLNSFG